MAPTFLILVGGAFLLVGLADLVPLWIPPRFDSVGWEFATVGRTLDGLPMPLLGLVLVTYGLLRRPGMGDRALPGLAAVHGVAALALLALGLLLLTVAPAVIAVTPPESLDALRRSLVRHGMQAVAYPIVLVTAAILFWRAAGSEP